MRESFMGPLAIIRLIRNNADGFRLTKEFSRKHPVFQVSFVKPYHQTGEDRFPSRNKRNTLQYIVQVGDFPVPVKKIITTRKIRINGKDHRQHFVRFKNQASDKERCFSEDAISDGDLHLRIFRASRRDKQPHQ
ncbi:hypothetical protein O181_120226 [Austropuccinia psidii MF-1]|uniref:Uncharacterized protein n=1 Tax=Austropuccinia psidii MF-1 TaxID=1389203 RepID=A0A9Q3KI11_9BASI|nr:hypothetical protein [Austropuccinia psidii MF-1]